MTTPTLGPADVTINAVVEVPLEGGDLVVRDDTQRARYFAADKVTVTYAQNYTDAGSDDEVIGPWEIAAAVSGPIITGGSTGKRRASRTFHDEDDSAFPSWLAEVIDRYHPGKVAAS